MRMRELRKQMNITMKQLGDMLGVSESAISHYETGKRQADFETLLKIAEIYDVSLDYLLGRTDTPEPQKSAPDETQIDMSTLDFALQGVVRDLDEDDKADLLKNAERMRELKELRGKKREDKQ